MASCGQRRGRSHPDRARVSRSGGGASLTDGLMHSAEIGGAPGDPQQLDAFLDEVRCGPPRDAPVAALGPSRALTKIASGGRDDDLSPLTDHGASSPPYAVAAFDGWETCAVTPWYDHGQQGGTASRLVPSPRSRGISDLARRYH
jgi:hypothetical protein